MKPIPPILLAAVLGPVAAQGPAFSCPTITRPHAATIGSPTDACVGEFHGSGYMDHATVVGGTAWVHSMPRYGGACQAVPGLAGVTSLATRYRDHYLLGDDGGQRHRDELLIAHGGGLSRYWADGQGHVESIAGAQFASARALIASDIDGDGDLDIVAIAANGRDVLALLATPAGFGPTLTWRNGATVYAIDTVRLAGNSVRQVAIATNVGLTILAPGFTGTATTVATGSATAGCLTAVRNHDDTEALAWVRRDAAGNSILRVYPHPQAEVALGQLGVVGITAGDVNGDSDEDLILSQTFDQCITLMLHQGTLSPAMFSYQGLASVQMRLVDNGETLPAPTNLARPRIADMNGDGDLDVVVALPSHATCILESVGADHGGQLVLPSAGDLTFNGDILSVTATVTPGTAAAFGYTHVEVMTWDVTQDEGVFTAKTMGSIQGCTPIAEDLKVTFSGTRSAYESGGGFLLMWRAVRIDPTTNVVERVGPAACGFLVEESNTPALATLPGAHVTAVSMAELIGTFQLVGGIRQVGWVTVEPPTPTGTSGPN